MLAEETENTYTLRPGESSVYSLSIVFDEPPAPAARVELGFETVLPVARRLIGREEVFTSPAHHKLPHDDLPDCGARWFGNPRSRTTGERSV